MKAVAHESSPVRVNLRIQSELLRDALRKFLERRFFRIAEEDWNDNEPLDGAFEDSSSHVLILDTPNFSRFLGRKFSDDLLVAIPIAQEGSLEDLAGALENDGEFWGLEEAWQRTRFTGVFWIVRRPFRMSPDFAIFN
jgi:hypothetical protein